MSARPVGTWLLVGAGIAVAASLAAAIATTGSPAQQRLKRFDERRERDLQGLQVAVDAHYRVEGRLPASLDVLAGGRAWDADSFRDPATAQPYEYRVLDARRYELCARFSTASRHPRPAAVHGHPAGRHCIRHAVDAQATVD